MKNFIVKTMAVVCFLGGLFVMTGCYQKENYIGVLVGLLLFSGIVPLSRSEVFEEKSGKQ